MKTLRKGNRSGDVEKVKVSGFISNILTLRLLTIL
jgi:hypothetical protein